MAPSRSIDLKGTIGYSALRGRNVLLTGGASGLGKALAYMFVANGANLVIADVQEGPGKQLEQELASSAKVKFLLTDVTSFVAQVALLREAIAFFPRGEIDIYLPVAGIAGVPTHIGPRDPAELATLREPPKDLTSKVIEVNLTGVWIGTMLVARYGMGLHNVPDKESKPTKSIVLMTSLAGYRGAEACVEYTTAKYGVRGLLRGLRKQLAGMGVRLNAVAPFYVKTPMTEPAIPMFRKAGIPIATVEQVTEAVARLSTDEEAYGRSVFVMPEGLLDGGDDSAGGQGGKSFSVDTLGEQWAVFVHGSMSDEIQA